MDFDKFANGSHHDAPPPRSIKPIETFPYLSAHGRVSGIGKDFSYGFSTGVSAKHSVNCLIASSRASYREKNSLLLVST